jgi:TfoX/Sxy family transcriptional regulator of competence genes
MVFDESLAARIRDALVRKRGVEEKKMFGGVGFLLNGNLLVGVWKDSLIVRLGKDEGGEALREPHVGEFNIAGRPMRNWVLVEPEGVEDDEQLSAWIRRGVKFVGALPAKEK